MGVKIGNLDISAFKVGGSDCSIYLGDVKLYPTAEPNFKWKATYTGGSVTTAECDSSSAIIAFEIPQTTDLASVEIGDCVTSIGSSALQGRTITSATISNSVTSIDSQAFYGCGGLIKVTVLATTPPTLGSAVFAGGASNLAIYVPASSVSAYKSAWSSYRFKIKAIP